MEVKKFPWEKQKSVPRVAVLGDLILDEYLEGQVKRISPEAPVPVHTVERSRYSAGGAANAALNIKLVGGEALLLGVIGSDQSGEVLTNLLSSYGLTTTGLIVDHSRPTIKKTRISAGRQQMVRVDWEKIKPLAPDLEKSLLALLEKAEVDAILLSDYGKGILTTTFIRQVLALARQLQCEVIIDPKGYDYSRYAGAYLVTPNRKEACAALGLDESDSIEPEDLARQLIERYGLQNVMVTLGEQGMILCSGGAGHDSFHVLPAKAREVFDVSGAGDTVAGLMSLSVAAQMPIGEAMKIANLAAGVVVGKWGTQPVTHQELLWALKEDVVSGSRLPFSTERKILSVLELKQIIGPIESRTKQIVFTNGCFDLLHAGHVTYLEKARAKGDVLVVGVNSDKSVRAIKGEQRPIVGCEDRMRVLAGLGCVDYVVSFGEQTPERLIKDLMPNVLIKGADWALGEIVGAEVVEKAGGMVDHIELVPGISTTEIIRRVQTSERSRPDS